MNPREIQELVGSTLEAHLPLSHTTVHHNGENGVAQEVTTVPSTEAFSGAKVVAIVIADKEHDSIKKLAEIKEGLSAKEELSIIAISRTGTEAQVMDGLGTYWYRGQSCDVSHVRYAELQK